MKKGLFFVTLIMLSFSIVACNNDTTTVTTNEDIVVNVNTNSVTVIEGESYQLVVTSNDPVGLEYSVNVENIISLSDTGYITGLAEGSVVVTITSKYDDSVMQNVTVEVRKQITLSSNALIVNLTEQETNQLVITSNDGVRYDVQNSEICSVSSDGLITALGVGSTTINVTSTYDESKTISITVNVRKLVTISFEKEDYTLVVGDTELIQVTSNDGLTFLSGNTNVVTVDEDGQLTAIGFGETIVRVTSTYDTSLQEEVTVTVYKYTEEISINGSSSLIKGMSAMFEVIASPVGAYSVVTWESSDETILTVDEQGNVQAVGEGNATIIAKSVLDDTIADTFNVTVMNILVVDSTLQSGDVYDLDGLELQFGEQLFSTLSSALGVATEGTLVKVESGHYIENVTVNLDGITIEGISETSSFEGTLTINANDVTITNMLFSGNASITNSTAISNFTFSENNASQITASNNFFINLNSALNTVIIDNTFNTITSGAICLQYLGGEQTIIQSNSFSNMSTAMSLTAKENIASTDVLKIYWNVIDQVINPFIVDMSYSSTEQEFTKIARFNQVTNYASAVIANTGSTFDFTLNYWGTEELDYGQFVHVDAYYLKGNYPSSTMPTETSYNPLLPIIITITNPIDEIMIGETYTFTYEILPYELSDASVRFITGNPSLVTINTSGTITPLSSGAVYIQIRSAQVSTIRTQLDFAIITTPGIEIVTDSVSSAIEVGDTFTLSTLLFPYTIEGESSSIVSSAPMVADINSQGFVTTYGEGLVTFTASLDSDPSVNVSYTVYVHGALDSENNLLDYLTTQQVAYSTIHEWVAYGFEYNYFDTRAESVSRYYFGDIPINTSKLVPVSSGIRPGEPMDPLPEGVTQYNPYNVYWIVVHDTASTATGSNALAHANYLYNNAIAGTELWVSWHFTVDSVNIYQHLPEIERGYHAGDGSTLPTLGGTYLGGGNRNGIGIEMAINQDGDMYRTWQRTAKLAAYLLEKYSLPEENQKFHVDFSGKNCPHTLREAGLTWLFEEFVASEYYMQTNHKNAVITFTSNNPEYLDNTGRIIKIPERALTVSYTITVTENSVTQSRTFYTYIPGSVR
ncbi:MAG: Ig-like domain-containing protein [Candidatus Izemoplasmatales bacterium]